MLVANHASHLDTPAILRAMPAAWRDRTVVAAAADHFYVRRSVAGSVSLLLNTVPVSRGGGGADALEHVQELVGRRLESAHLRGRHALARRQPRQAAFGRGADRAAAGRPDRARARHRNARRRCRRTRPGRIGCAAASLSRRHSVDVGFGAPVEPQPDETPAQMMARVAAFVADEG